MLHVPNGAFDYAWRVDSVGTTRPAAALGATITPGNNTKGTYAEVMTGAQMARDAFGLLIHFNSNFVAAAARDTIVDIGVDPAGGTSYSILIPDLLASCAAPCTLGGIWYFFPIWVRAGSSIAARASINNATVGTLRCRIIAFGSPRNRSMVKVGTRVEALGIVAASSRGTTITSGTTSEGLWTQLGTTSRKAWWWQLGMGCNDTTMSALAYFADLGVGDTTNKFVTVENQLWCATATEQLSCDPRLSGAEYPTPSGTDVFGRLQCSGTADAGLSLAAYALS